MRTYWKVIVYSLVSTTAFLGTCLNSIAQAEGATPAKLFCCPAAQACEPANATCCEKENLSPAITFDSTVCDLGRVGLRTKNTCDFRFTNTGRAPLKITNVKTLSVF